MINGEMRDVIQHRTAAAVHRTAGAQLAVVSPHEEYDHAKCHTWYISPGKTADMAAKDAARAKRIYSRGYVTGCAGRDAGDFFRLAIM